jgi:hypothetical protein
MQRLTTQEHRLMGLTDGLTVGVFAGVLALITVGE